MIVLDVLLAVLALSVLPAVWRMVSGPVEIDRAVATDHVFFAFIAAVALLAVRLDNPTLLVILVVATLAGFLATVGLARLVDRKES